MDAYLVRLRDGQPHAREIVGIYVAETMEQLFWLVDDCVSPDDCECLPIGPGGIFWDRFTGHQVPRAEISDSDEDDSLPPSPSLSDNWDDQFLPDDAAPDEHWERIVWTEDEPERSLPALPPRGRRRRRRLTVRL